MFCSHCIFDHLAYLGNPCQLSNVGVVVVGVVVVVVSCCCFFLLLLLFLLCYDHLRATGWSPQNTFLTKNQHFGYHQNHLKVFTCLDSCSCVLCGSSLKFSPKDHGRPDPRTWRRASRAAAALFGSWKNYQSASNWAKPTHCYKKTRFSFFFFSICFCFCIFLRLISFLFSILADFFRFRIKFDKIQKCKKTSFFFSFLSMYFRFFRLFLFFPSFF